MTRGTTGREFLFLQGLAGPFFGKLGAALAGAGHGVHRVNFNGGDRLFWPLPGAIDFRGGVRSWPAFLERVLTGRGITDILLFGDCRPLHRAAIAMAARTGIQVHVFEEGYIRPDWVTLELGGVNGHSSLPRDPDYYLGMARGLPAPEPRPPVLSSFDRRVREDLTYNIGTLAMAVLYPGYRTHRPWHILVEYAGWLGKFARRSASKRRSAAALDGLRAGGRPYFVFPLQLDCDYQVRTHSSFDGMEAAIERVVGSFARHAPPDTVLVVKAHPLDNGLRDWRRLTLAVAARHGQGDNLVFVEDGDVATMVRAARGVVTINSTSGTLALACGVPVVTLGQAVYDLPRVTFQGTLAEFWSAPVPPDPEVWDAFRRVLVHRCLVHGGFFSDDGLASLVEASKTRLENAAGTSAGIPQDAATPVMSMSALVAARG